jgi:hypothetical protein
MQPKPVLGPEQLNFYSGIIIGAQCLFRHRHCCRIGATEPVGKLRHRSCRSFVDGLFMRRDDDLLPTS